MAQFLNSDTGSPTRPVVLAAAGWLSITVFCPVNDVGYWTLQGPYFNVDLKNSYKNDCTRPVVLGSLVVFSLHVSPSHLLGNCRSRISQRCLARKTHKKCQHRAHDVDCGGALQKSLPRRSYLRASLNVGAWAKTFAKHLRTDRYQAPVALECLELISADVASHHNRTPPPTTNTIEHSGMPTYKLAT